MKILLLCSVFNALARRLFVDLREAGHKVAVTFEADLGATLTRIDETRPDIVVAPILRRAIPAQVLARLPCLVIHPGPPGDAGPQALDHAILTRQAQWGVTVRRAAPELNAGPVCAARSFPMRRASKSSLYAREVVDAASACVTEALAGFAEGRAPAPPPAPWWRGRIGERDRMVSFEQDDADSILRKIASADGAPGALALVGGRHVHLYDAHPEGALTGPPGAVLARREGALCLAARRGAVWIGHARSPAMAGATGGFKQAAATLLARESSGAPHSPMPAPAVAPAAPTLQDITYREADGVGALRFDFYNGGMGALQARRLGDAMDLAAARPTRVLVLQGGERFWSTGIDLMSVEAAREPAAEAWDAANAFADLMLRLIGMTDKLTFAALSGGAAAGGMFLALACDEVLARRGALLTAHGLTAEGGACAGYSAYLASRRLNPTLAASVLGARRPVGVDAALRTGLVDRIGPPAATDFAAWAAEQARAAAADPELSRRLVAKAARRAEDEARQPLASWREREMERLRGLLFDPGSAFHQARRDFLARPGSGHTAHHVAPRGGWGALAAWERGRRH